MRQVFGNDTSEAWKKLAPRILTVTKGWSEAYGLFLEEEALMVLSYTTSPAYHRHVDKTERYRAAAFSEGHYAQIEVAAKVAHSPNQALADQFLAFMLSPEFQNIIPTTNWMYPATRSHTALPAAFNGLVSPKTTLLFDASVVAHQRKIWIREWLDALTD
jgi:thiamine transport system substrate-binding protein